MIENVFCVLLIFLLTPLASAQTLTATGDAWIFEIGADDLESPGAGQPLRSTYESSSTAVEVDVEDVAAEDWTVDVRRTDDELTPWPQDLELSVRWTDQGTGTVALSGGSTYVDIQEGGGVFFSGTDNRTGIQLQYQLSGVSLSTPPGTYNTTVLFTVTLDN
ncbi:MAG: hypothetical protein WD314_09345 [Trueperaceae bacterium]